MLKFVLGVSLWGFAVAGYLHLYDTQPQLALIFGLAFLVLFVGLTMERKK
jgi:hypothetical protein